MNTTPLNRAIEILDRIGVSVNEQRAIDHGAQLRLDNGAIVNVYQTGSVVIQGPPPAAAPIKAAFAAAGSLKLPKATPAPVSMRPPVAPAPAPEEAHRLPSKWSDKAPDPDDDTPPW